MIISLCLTNQAAQFCYYILAILYNACMVSIFVTSICVGIVIVVLPWGSHSHRAHSMLTNRDLTYVMVGVHV